MLETIPPYCISAPSLTRRAELSTGGGLAARWCGDCTQHGGNQGLLGVGVVDAPSVQLAAGRVRDCHEHREMPVGGSILAEDAICLSPPDERAKAGEDVTVPGVELLVSVRLGVDVDERVVASEGPPGAGDDASECFGCVAALRLGGFDDAADFGERALGNGFE